MLTVALAGLCTVGIPLIKVACRLNRSRYGKPLVLGGLEDEYHTAIESNDKQRVRAVATELTARIEHELGILSVNAPNWYAFVPRASSDVDECFQGCPSFGRDCQTNTLDGKGYPS